MISKWVYDAHTYHVMKGRVAFSIKWWSSYAAQFQSVFVVVMFGKTIKKWTFWMPFSIMYCSSQHHRVLVVFLDFQSPSKQVVAPPQRPTAAGLYSNPHDCPCTLSGDLHGGRRAVLKIWNFEHFSYCNTYSDLARGEGGQKRGICCIRILWTTPLMKFIY